MTVQVGYPDSALEESVIEEKHTKMFVQKNDFFQNILYGISFKRDVEEQRLLSSASGSKGNGAPNEGSINWGEEGSSASAFYEEGVNRVFIPHQILLPPFFDPSYPRSFLYGTIGVDVAQAITQGLLSNDLMVDKRHEGIDVYTTTPSSLIEPLPPFAEESTNCIKKIIVERGLAPIGIANRTALDTFVHINAVRLASEALMQVSLDGLHVHQPGLEDYESDNIFFLALGQALCSVMTPQELDAVDTMGKSLRDPVLLKITLSQIDKFSEAFDCSTGSLTVCR